MPKQKGFYKRILGLFKPFWKYFAIVFGLMLVGQVIGTFSPYLFGKSVDAVTNGDVNATVRFLLIAVALSYLQQQILIWIREYYEIKKLDRNVDVAFSVLSLQRMLKFSVGQHINEHSGVKQNIVNKGQNALSHVMYDFVYNLFPSSLQIIVTLVILAFFRLAYRFRCCCLFGFVHHYFLQEKP